jgi:hypothetical protein
MSILTVRKGYTLRAFGNGVLRIMLQRKREVISGQRRVHNGDLHISYSSAVVSDVNNFMRMGRARYVAE